MPLSRSHHGVVMSSKFYHCPIIFPVTITPGTTPVRQPVKSPNFFPVNPMSIMAAPVNPYVALPSVWIMALFEVEVEVMDKASLSSSSSLATTSQKLSDHHLG